MFEALFGSIAVTLLSLIGVVFFGTSGHLKGSHRFILPAAIGVFIGVVFFELIPETIEASHEWGPVAIVAGFLGFYLLSYILDTFHHHHFDHDDHCTNKNGARKLLIGDGVHNFADGVVIVTAFMIDPSVGILTTIGIALHEAPQEIAEFGVLLHAGYTKKKAALLNLLSASTVIIGAGATILFAEFLHDYIFVLTGLAAGNLLYIAIGDLLPELRDSHKDHFAQTFLATLLGVIAIAILVHFSHEFVAGH